MIIDFSKVDSNVVQDSDVLVVGAGTCGLLLADKLRAYGLRVDILESGGEEQSEPVHPLNHVVQLGRTYRGAMHGRFRCLGGTSTRWGGALIPFLREDMEARPHIGLDSWPVSIADLDPLVEDLEKFFGLDPLPYDERVLTRMGVVGDVPRGDSGLAPRFAKWATFRNRNVATLIRDRLQKDANLKVWLNATAIDFDVDELTQRIRAVTARHTSGRQIRIRATNTVICAGAIESTRLLLLLNAQHDGRIFNNRSGLGRYLFDHLSVRLAYLHAKDVRRLNRLAGLRFVGSTIRSFRLELTPEAQRNEGIASAFAHINFVPGGATGFDALRALMREVQQTGRLSARHAIGTLTDLPFFLHAAYWRFANKQLYWPSPARYELHIDGEQLPRPDNLITLSSDRDRFGLPLAAIDWNIRQADTLVFSAMKRHIDEFWHRHRLSSVAHLDWAVTNERISPEDLPEVGDIFHPGGTTRMGTNGNNAIVNGQLQTFAIRNLWVLSTSTFPSGASANPTMMLLLFCLRLANHLGRTALARHDTKEEIMRAMRAVSHIHSRRGTRRKTA